jgi:hypothetical protein
MRYYSLEVAGSKRWFLDLAAESPPIDIWKCQESDPGAEPVELKVFQPGPMVDFDRVSFGIPVFSHRAAIVVQRICGGDVQLLNATVHNPQSEMRIANITRCIDCIDREKSLITYYSPDHLEKPGEISGVLRLFVDSEAAKNHHMLRPMGWEIALIVSEVVKRELEAIEFTGGEFWPAT